MSTVATAHVLVTDRSPTWKHVVVRVFQNTHDPSVPMSSMKWYQMMAQAARLTKVPRSKKGIADKINQMSEFLCKNRHKQNLKSFVAWTAQNDVSHK